MRCALSLVVTGLYWLLNALQTLKTSISTRRPGSYRTWGGRSFSKFGSGSAKEEIRHTWGLAKYVCRPCSTLAGLADCHMSSSVRTQNPISSRTCPHCGKVCTSVGNLRQHMQFGRCWSVNETRESVLRAADAQGIDEYASQSGNCGPIDESAVSSKAPEHQQVD